MSGNQPFVMSPLLQEFVAASEMASDNFVLLIYVQPYTSSDNKSTSYSKTLKLILLKEAANTGLNILFAGEL